MINRRTKAHAIETRTMTATTFCIALTAVHSTPSKGIERIDWMRPPVTMLAVPMVRSTKPQKIPACMTPALTSLNILVWTSAYSTRPPIRSGTLANGCDGRATAKIRRCRAMARTKNAAAPQNTGKTKG